MANFSALYDYILPYVPGVETPLVDVTIRRVLRDFYKRTTIWRETFTFNTTADQPLYQLVPSSGSVAAIMSVEVAGRPIGVLPEDKRPTPAVAAAQEATTPSSWYATFPALLALNPKPLGGISVVVSAAITLSLDLAALTFSDDTFDEFGEEIGSGVVGALMSMPGKPWTQNKAAGDYLGKYVRCVSATRARLRDGGQPNATTITPAARFGK